MTEDVADVPKGKRPAFQFYAGDWQRDMELRMCSLAARGLWIEMMAIMHWATPYGHLVVNGIAPRVAELAKLVGDSPASVKRLLAELERHNVYSKTTDGAIYSRRMVRDEAVRLARAKGGATSLNNPNVPRPKDEHKDDLQGHPSPPSSGGSPSVSVSPSSSDSPQTEKGQAPQAAFISGRPASADDAPADQKQIVKPPQRGITTPIGAVIGHITAEREALRVEAGVH